MDIQFWIWVAVIVLSLLARANKNKNKQKGMPTSLPGAPDADSTKPMTFEDLLREIEGTKEAARPKPVVRAPEVVDYDDELKDEEEDLETVPDYRKTDPIYDVYEKAKSDAFLRPSLEETAKLQDTVVRFGQFRSYSKDEAKPQVSVYLRDFQDKESFKRAFIMSEILKRRF